MLKNILWALLVCIFTFISGSVFHQAAAADVTTNKETNNPKKYTFLFYVQGLNYTDIDGPGLPNIKKLKSEGVSYSHVAQSTPTTNTDVLVPLDNRFLLTKILANNDINCLAVDGTGAITVSQARGSNLELISEKNDQLAVDKLLDKLNDNSYQFTAIFLNDTSIPDKLNNSSRFQPWSLADNQVGRVLNHLIKNDRLSSSTIIITGNGETPPLIIYNSNIGKPESYFYCCQLDIAPTICKIHGITPPAEMPGHILYESLPVTNSQILTGDLKKRIGDLQKECQYYNEQISVIQKEYQSIESQKAEIKKERENIHRIISEKDSTTHRLLIQIKILKFAGAVIVILLLTGYVFLYRWLRKKYLIFP
ncbi:hypothetical protein [Desulfallas thermosapovorans]|uniref:Uncharacterized protein n=1 Tax=Desulfallas thermosapovorans DSM 6562 TaxID=1121431 RepID=A0A5S4ZQW4_9FIRM|nr:hypothetical protein [Desulfallas thermosapovorans]TYO95006.1 hypothetical protein LX24_02028 [Desulfallas thermosapovorans DSM 6562]